MNNRLEFYTKQIDNYINTPGCDISNLEVLKHLLINYITKNPNDGFFAIQLKNKIEKEKNINLYQELDNYFLYNSNAKNSELFPLIIAFLTKYIYSYPWIDQYSNLSDKTAAAIVGYRDQIKAKQFDNLLTLMQSEDDQAFKSACELLPMAEIPYEQMDRLLAILYSAINVNVNELKREAAFTVLAKKFKFEERNQNKLTAAVVELLKEDCSERLKLLAIDMI